MGKLLGTAASFVGKAVADSGTLARVAKRIGLSGSNVTVTKVVTAVRENKVAAAFALYELGAAAAPLLADLTTSDPDLQALMDSVSNGPVDQVDPERPSDVTRFADEFRALSTAIQIVGGMEAFLALERALATSPATRALYLQVRDMGRVL